MAVDTGTGNGSSRSKQKATIARALGRGIFPHQLSWLIDNALRRLIIHPDVLAARLLAAESDKLLELGPGSGYFSAAIQRRIPAGALYLVDVQPEMLFKARRKLAPAADGTVCFAVTDANGELPFGNDTLDGAVLVSVLGEVKDQATCLSSLRRVLRPNGSLTIHESIPDPDLIRFSQLVNLVEGAGFRFERRWGPSFNYTARFLNTRS